MTKKMDRIILEGLTFYAYHGVYEEETNLGQRFIIDIECGLDLENVSRSDNIGDSINYMSITRTVETVVTENKFRLIERLAGAILEALFNLDSRILEQRIRIYKPSAPLQISSGTVSVELTRNRTT